MTDAYTDAKAAANEVAANASLDAANEQALQVHLAAGVMHALMYALSLRAGLTYMLLNYWATALLLLAQGKVCTRFLSGGVLATLSCKLVNTLRPLNMDRRAHLQLQDSTDVTATHYRRRLTVRYVTQPHTCIIECVQRPTEHLSLPLEHTRLLACALYVFTGNPGLHCRAGRGHRRHP